MALEGLFCASNHSAIAKARSTQDVVPACGARNAIYVAMIPALRDLLRYVALRKSFLIRAKRCARRLSFGHACLWNFRLPDIAEIRCFARPRLSAAEGGPPVQNGAGASRTDVLPEAPALCTQAGLAARQAPPLPTLFAATVRSAWHNRFRRGGSSRIVPASGNLWRRAARSPRSCRIIGARVRCPKGVGPRSRHRPDLEHPRTPRARDRRDSRWERWHEPTWPSELRLMPATLRTSSRASNKGEHCPFERSCKHESSHNSTPHQSKCRQAGQVKAHFGKQRQYLGRARAAATLLQTHFSEHVTHDAERADQGNKSKSCDTSVPERMARQAGEVGRERKRRHPNALNHDCRRMSPMRRTRGRASTQKRRRLGRCARRFLTDPE